MCHTISQVPKTYFLQVERGQTRYLMGWKEFDLEGGKLLSKYMRTKFELFPVGDELVSATCEEAVRGQDCVFEFRVSHRRLPRGEAQYVSGLRYRGPEVKGGIHVHSFSDGDDIVGGRHTLLVAFRPETVILFDGTSVSTPTVYFLNPKYYKPYSVNTGQWHKLEDTWDLVQKLLDK